MKKNKFILYSLFLSGMAALIYEITWIRPITLVLKSTIFVVSSVLGAFMLGLALGGFVIAIFAKRIKKPFYLYALCEFAIGLYGLLLLELFNFLPRFFNDLSQTSSASEYFLNQLLMIFVLLLVPTCLMGATFPLVAKGYVEENVGEGIGEIFTFNNIGAIFGTLLAGFILVPKLGIHKTIVIAALFNFISATLVLFIFYRKKLYKIAIVFWSLFLILSLFTRYDLNHLYQDGIFGFKKRNYIRGREVVFYDEGSYGTLLVFREGPDKRIYRLGLSGQGSSSLRFTDVRVTTLLGILPLLKNPDAKNALVIGYGTGGTSNLLARHMKTTTVEIEPKILKTSQYFKVLNSGVLENVNHEVIFDDGRNYLLRSKKKYDVIVNHPLEPYQSFSSLLFTKEFYDLVERQLSPKGVYVQWMPFYDLRESDFLDFLYTINQVFPHIAAFHNLKKGEYTANTIPEITLHRKYSHVRKHGEELILLATKEPFDALEEIRKNYANLSDYDRSYLTMTNLDSFGRIQNLLAFTDRDFGPFLKNSRMITDDQPYLEFTTAIQEASKKDEKKIMDLVTQISKSNLK